MLKWWRVPLYPDWINAENTIIWVVAFQIQLSNSNSKFCVCRFLLQNVLLKLINIFLFLVFILVDAFSDSIKTEKSQKNLFTLAENNFGERKLSCNCLNFDEILFAGTKRVVPGGQYRSILPARVANQNTEFAVLPARGACHIIKNNIKTIYFLPGR